MPTARRVCSTKATGELPCARTRATRDRSSPRAIPRARCPCGLRWWRTSRGRCSPRRRSRSAERLEGVQVRDAVRKCRRVLREPPRDDDRQARDSVAAAGFPVSADISRPRQRQSHRHHGEAGRHASRVPALPRRQLPGRQPDRDAFRLEEDDRPAGGPSDAPHHVELPLLRRHGLAGVPGMVRGPAHAAGSRHLCRILSRRTGGEAGAGSRAVRAGRAGGDRVRHRRRRHQVGRRARARRASGAVQAALRRDRQRRQFRPGQDLRRPLCSVLQGDQGEVPEACRSSPPCR